MKKSVILVAILLLSITMLRGQTSRAEYYFDTDPGVGKGIPVTALQTGTVGEFTGDVSTAALSSGFHRLYFRFIDDQGRWGLTENNLLFVYSTTPEPPVTNQPQIGAFEYYFDTDPGSGNGNRLAVTGVNDTASITQNISTNGLATGFHRLYFRTADKNGKWSLAENNLLYVYSTTPPSIIIQKAPIVALEYFIDKDPGTGLGKAVASFNKGDSITVTADLNTTGLAVGSHSVNIRAKDSLNRWSIYERKQIYVCATLPIAEFHADTVNIGSTTTFTNKTTGGDASSNYQWDINNDGTVEFTTIGNISYKFTTAGIFNVKLTTSNGVDCMTSIIKKVVVKDNTGINDIDCSDKIKLYPNPTTGKVEIKLEDPLPLDYSISVYNLNGMILGTYIKRLNDVTNFIDISEYPSGIYFIKISSKKQSYRTRVTKY